MSGFKTGLIEKREKSEYSVITYCWIYDKISQAQDIDTFNIVEETMSRNISKKKRDDLLDKIKEIRKYIASAPQDENTGNLLLYLDQIEKDINGKKYGLVFEEHREKINDILDTHTPVLEEDKELFIDRGNGRMNLLIEGDNLSALKLLEKTHKGKIDLIYIDPPYNRGVDDFKYDDNYITKSDGYIHSKWISFMEVRLKIAHKLLRNTGAMISLLCRSCKWSTSCRRI